MKKKLKLNDLKVNSFVTESNPVKGGVDTTIQIAIQATIVECYSLHECKTLPADQCVMTVAHNCPTVNKDCITVDYACPSNPVMSCLQRTGLCIKF